MPNGGFIVLIETRKLAIVASFAAALAAGNAAAQESEAAAKPNLSTEEIVVTARKRQESLQDVPLSVTAFTAEKLQQVGAFDNEDVALLTPNFNTNRQVGRRLDRPTIRGQSAPSTGAAPNASYFVDGVFVSGSVQTLTLGPVERVEILRGPQSAQFGRATFSGAINYVTKRPTNEFSAETKLNAASHDSATVSGWASGPLVRDSLYAFGSVSYDTYGGEYRNSLKFAQAPRSEGAIFDAPVRGDNSKLGGTETKDIALKLLWTPSDTTDVTFKASLNKGDDDHYAQILQEIGELNCYLPTQGGANGSPDTIDNTGEIWYSTSPGSFCGKLDPDKVQYNPVNPFDPRSATFALRHDPNSFDNPFAVETYPQGFYFTGTGFATARGIAYTLPANGAPREARFNLPDLNDGINGNIGCGLGSGDTIEKCTAAPARPGTKRTLQRYLTQLDQDFGDWTWTSRLAYNQDELTQAYDLDRTEQRPVLGTGLFNMVEEAVWEDYTFETRIQSPGDTRLRGQAGVNYFKQDRSSNQRRFLGFADGQFSATPLEQETKNYAVFGTLDYDISDQWTASVEARLSKEEREIDSGAACDDPSSPYFGQTNTGESTVRSFTPRFTLRYQPTDETSIYALAAYGEKPAEFVLAWFRTIADQCDSIAEAQKPDGGLTRIDPEEAWTYETGIKTSWMDRRLTTNLSVFFIDWENQAVSQNTPIGGTLTQINVNSGTSEVYGLELESTFVFTENLTGQFSYGLANGYFTNYNDENLAQLTGDGLVFESPGVPATDPVTGGLIYDASANNAKDNRLPGSPKHSFIFGLNYANELSLNLFEGAETLEWFARTDFVLETERYSQANNFTEFPNRKLWNGRIGLDSDNWTVTAYVNNILDDLTPTGIFNFPVITGAVWASGTMPTQNSMSPAYGRAYGLELLYRFGD